VLVSLTDAGAEAQQRTGARHARSVEERMRSLTPEQQQQLRDLCTLLTTTAVSAAPGPRTHEDRRKTNA
jgi:DNA-binding MarR family transcriptional regulator